MTTIKVNDQSPRVQYTPLAAQVDFDIPFRFYEDADIKIYFDDETTAQSSGYTLTGTAAETGMKATFSTAPYASGVTKITILRDMAVKRETNWTDSGDWSADSVNEQMNKLVMMIQQVELAYDRAIKPAATSSTTTLTLPDPTDGTVIGWDGTKLANLAPSNLDFATVSAFAQTLLDDADAGEALTTLGVSAFAQTLLDDADAAATRTTLGVVIGTDVLAPNGDGSGLTGVSTEDQTARDMAAVALAMADANGVSGTKGPFYLADGFEADTLTTATNAIYNATDDVYEPDDDYSGFSWALSTDWTGKTASFSLSDTGDADHIDSADCAVYTSAVTLSGDFILEYGTATEGAHVGVMETGSTGSFNQNAPSGDCGVTEWWGVHPSSTTYAKYDNTNQSSDLGAAQAGDKWRITRESGTLKAYLVRSGVATLKHTWSQTSTNDMHIVVSCGNPAGTDDTTDIRYETGTASFARTNPIYVESGTLDTADPTDLMAYFRFVDNGGTLAPASDIAGTLSIDDGTTEAAGSWTYIGPGGGSGEEIWRLDADVSAQTGTSLRYELTGVNNKDWDFAQCIGVVPIY